MLKYLIITVHKLSCFEVVVIFNGRKNNNEIEFCVIIEFHINKNNFILGFFHRFISLYGFILLAFCSINRNSRKTFSMFIF